jgi:hypothetical protein
MPLTFKDKVIVILSPQPWNYLYISKHHYAKELSKKNTIYFISPPTHKWNQTHTIKTIEKRLFVVEYSVSIPQIVKFKFPSFFKICIKSRLRSLSKEFNEIDVVIDFGCYQFFDSMDFLAAKYKIFFPVDDSVKVDGSMRGANIAFTVSKKIQQKFNNGSCHFINHGLSEDFTLTAKQESIEVKPWKSSSQINVGYA